MIWTLRLSVQTNRAQSDSDRVGALHPSTPPLLVAREQEERSDGRTDPAERRGTEAMNFCTHCGNRLLQEERRWARLRNWCRACQCQDCRSMLRPRRRPYRRLTLLLLLAVLVVLIARWAVKSPTRGENVRMGGPVSAIDATARRIPEAQEGEGIGGDQAGVETEKEPAPETHYCGALTRRGTPCRRRVRPGERCAQHRQPPRSGASRP